LRGSWNINRILGNTRTGQGAAIMPSSAGFG
jgi:hypothetical protein